MKIVIAGLISLFLFACQHAEPFLPREVSIELFSLGKDKRFVSPATNKFEYQISTNQKIKIFRFLFSKSKDLDGYILNRRMLLQSSFESHIAPYVGMIKSDQSCLSSTDVKGNLIELNPETEYFSMKFPINKNEVVEGCDDDNRWGQITYSFYNCKKTNELFEIRYIRSVQSEAISIQAECKEEN